MKFNPPTSAAALLGRTRRQRYQQVPAHDEHVDDEAGVSEEERERERDENRALIHTQLWTAQIRVHKKIAVAVLTVILVLIGGWIGTVIYENWSETQCDTVRHGFRCKPELSQYWGQYSPYFSVPSEIPNELPEGCQLNFVQVLSRHGARDPTFGKSLRYKSLIDRIHARTKSYSKPFAFLKDYKYELGSDQLSHFGQQEMINGGAQFYDRYSALTKDITPFIRASGQQRVIESAQNWTQGFHLSRLDDETSTAPEHFPYDILIVPESPDFNNTLDFTLCTNFFNSGYGQAAQASFASVFTPPITTRINSNLRGADLNDVDIISLMDLCPFSTVASATGQISPFCDLFNIDEWRNYDYYQTLGKHYGFTFPNPLAPTQGVGFTNELIARLTGKPVNDHTSTNRTLDGSNITFPLQPGGRGVYADFSHDNDMTTIFAALGLYNSTELKLPTHELIERNDERLAGYSAAFTVPFGARMFVEKMVCASGGAEPGRDESGEQEELVRIIVNDRVVPLRTCGADGLGRCTLAAFVESLSFAKEGGKWDQCFTAESKGKEGDEGDDEEDAGDIHVSTGKDKHKAKIEADGSDHKEDVKQDAKAKHMAKIDGGVE